MSEPCICNFNYTKTCFSVTNKFRAYLLSYHMAKVLISGGSGMIGQALTRFLQKKGYEVMILSKGGKSSEQQGVSFANWDLNAGTMDEKAIEGTDHIVHLAGANVAEGRWT